MLLGKVVGRVTSTVKHPSMEGWRLLVVQPYLIGGDKPDGDPLLAIDNQSASPGDMVILSSDGRATREMMNSDTTPVRWSVLGIQDS